MPIYMRNMGEEMPYHEVEAGWVFKVKSSGFYYLKTSADVPELEFVDICLADGDDLFADTPEDGDTLVVVVSKDPQINIKL